MNNIAQRNENENAGKHIIFIQIFQTHIAPIRSCVAIAAALYLASVLKWLSVIENIKMGRNVIRDLYFSSQPRHRSPIAFGRACPPTGPGYSEGPNSTDQLVMSMTGRPPSMIYKDSHSLGSS